MSATSFLALPDLAARPLGGTVMWANDEFYALRDNLITPGPPVFDVTDFNHRGKVYDGWETRRRREPGSDTVLLRLGLAGTVRGVVIDTANFTGNYPPFASVEGIALPGYPSAEQAMAADGWQELVPTSALKGDCANEFAVTDSRLCTHVRLTIHPDGGVARLRVHGDVVPDPRFLGGRVDLASIENGGRIAGCSNVFYSSPANVLAPGRARVMAEGWETARRRDNGNDWLVVELGAPGTLHHVIVDTSYFVGNAPATVSLRGFDARGLSGSSTPPDDPAEWIDLLPPTRVVPDTRHRFGLNATAAVTHVRLDIYPDGGVARLRVFGAVADDARPGIVTSWLSALGTTQAQGVLASCGIPAEVASAWLGSLGQSSTAAALAASVMQ